MQFLGDRYKAAQLVQVHLGLEQGHPAANIIANICTIQCGLSVLALRLYLAAKRQSNRRWTMRSKFGARRR
jgi:hypothetical protein